MFHTSVTQAICINARGHAELHALPGSYCSAWESSITFALITIRTKGRKSDRLRLAYP